MKKFVCKQTDEILDTDLLVIKKRKRQLEGKKMTQLFNWLKSINVSVN